MALKSCSHYLLRFIRIFADWFTCCIGIVYLPKKNYLPPIKNHLLLVPATDLSKKIRSGQLKCENVMKAYIERINVINPFLNALINDRFESALKEAQQLDIRIEQELTGKKPIDGVSIKSMPLLGIPFTCKECIAVKDMYFTAGLYSRKGTKADEDSQVVKNLREAGAIPIGVTNIPEFLLWWDSYNKIYGQTNNPYDNSRIPGGSSGGEAALISGAGSVVGIGSDLGGSIRIPAFCCGIYGHKPTPDIVPTSGMFPNIGHPDREKLLQFGPLCRYATDLRPILRAAAGKNSSLLKLDEEIDFSKLKVYYMENDCDPFKTSVSEEIKQVMHKVIDHLDFKTNNSSQMLSLPQMKSSFWIWLCAMSNMDAPSLASQLTQGTGKVNGWVELMKWLIGRSHYRLTTTANVIIEKMLCPEGTRDTETFKRLIAKGEEIKTKLNKLLESDAILLYPTQPETAVKHNQTFFKMNNCGYTMIFNVLGLPVTQVPLGLSKSGLPIGLQIVSGPFNDHLSIGVAEELEKTFGGWVPPCHYLTA